jgi:REP element-mobilizing transposase RayT
VAFAANRYNVQIHALCVLSNHWHCVATDPDGNLPKFLHWVHEYVAKCINASYGRCENMWSNEQTSVVHLVDDADVIDKIVYTLSNPVSAGLVAHGDSWPGVRTQPSQLVGTTEEVVRPPVFFRSNGSMPESCTLTIARPAICADLSDDALAHRVSELVAAKEAAIRDEHARRGVGFLGAKAILRQQPSDSPRTVAPHRNMSPRVAAKNKWSRIEALRRLRSFVEAHAEALHAWCAGMRDVVFPPGTYAMRVFHGVVCSPAP